MPSLHFLRHRPKLVSLIALTGCILLVGCSIVIDNDYHTSSVGRSISPELFTQVQPGKSLELVVTLLGTPTKTIPVDTGIVIMEWQYIETRNSSNGVIFLFHTESKTEQESSVYVEFKDGVVVKAWRDNGTISKSSSVNSAD